MHSSCSSSFSQHLEQGQVKSFVRDRLELNANFRTPMDKGQIRGY